MSDVVNLNRFRKKQKRAAKEKCSEENRVKFGRTKSERQAAQHQEEALNRHLDGHARDDSDA